MLTIVVPMAGRGSRFADAGYTLPKPLIPVHGVPMIRLVIENLRPSSPHRFVFIAQRAHDAEYGIVEKLKVWAPGAEVIILDGITEGAASTVLLARAAIDNDDPLMIANCDQYVDIDIDAYLGAMGDADGLIMTMTADDPKWSFVGFGENGAITEVVEKVVVSDEATVGIYNYARGRDFVRAADAMIAAGKRVNGEFYVAPAYNEMIAAGARLKVFNIGTVGQGMHGIGVPADLDGFLAGPVSRRAVDGLV